MPDTVLSDKGTTVNKISRILAPRELIVGYRGQIFKQVIVVTADGGENGAKPAGSSVCVYYYETSAITPEL